MLKQNHFFSKPSKAVSSSSVTFTHIHLESWKNLIALYETWNTPEKANEWQARLAQIEDYEK